MSVVNANVMVIQPSFSSRKVASVKSLFVDQRYDNDDVIVSAEYLVMQSL